MATHAPAAPEATPRGRRSSRASGDERERAILATAERLLEERPLSEISVGDLAEGAGISRPTFYFYFPSRDAVLLTLVERMADESASAIASQQDALAELHTDPRAGIRQALEQSYAAFSSRRAVILAAAELRNSNADANGLWSRVMEGWVAQVSGIIEAERARGAAPPGPPAREMATALVQMNERAQHATLSGEQPHIPDDAVIDTLVEIWLRAIYGVAD
ncbi:MAG TPA: TetR/AcrR family transcriptional regulator [Solirubrobacterales bacterium]|nr:TetR/AcrR family transcriptional regulator [Solirubrobacterales bacterium]